MKIKPKIKTSKLETNPLFIKFLNWKGDKNYIETLLTNLSNNFEEESDKKIIKDKLSNLTDDFLNSLSDFQKRFKAYVNDLISSKTISEEFLLWLDNTFKYVEEKVETYINDEIRKIKIKSPEGRWFEAICCYNFIMTFNYFGLNIIKTCPVCYSYFSNKGKYARYCSNSCKEIGMKKG